MDKTDKTDRIFQLFESDRPVNYWKLGLDGHVILTNSQNDRILDVMTEHGGIKKIIHDHFEKSDFPLIITNSLRMTWMVFADYVGEDDKYFYVIGPSFPSQAARDAACVYSGSDAKIIGNWKTQFQKIMSQLYIVPYHTLLSYGRMLCFFLSGQPTDSASFTYVYVDKSFVPHYAENILTDKNTALQKPDTAYLQQQTEDKFPLLGWAAEEALLHQIKKKNPYYRREINAVLSAVENFTSEKREASIRAFGFISLSCRTAAQSGLGVSSAMALERLYLSELEQKHSLSEIREMLHELYTTLMEMLLKADARLACSKQVKSCMEYIDLHVEDDIRLSALAAQNGYSDYYISRKFKRETGMSINEYILNTRLARAKELLLSTSLSVQVISDRLLFCSRSYFTKLFRQREGMTPTEYRRSMQSSPKEYGK